MYRESGLLLFFRYEHKACVLFLAMLAPANNYAVVVDPGSDLQFPVRSSGNESVKILESEGGVP